jgi:heme/copper-type cytochrome/quinol oxidase subunit 2
MNSAEAAIAASVFVGALMIAMALLAVFWVLTVIARWFMFAKAGEKGLKSLIPVYSDYTLFKLVWNTKSFWIWFGLAAITLITTGFSGQYVLTANGQLVVATPPSMFMSTLSFVASIGCLFWSAMLSLRTALAYGKLPSFGIGLFLLPNIFSLILAFGSAEYKGPQE